MKQLSAEPNSGELINDLVELVEQAERKQSSNYFDSEANRRSYDRQVLEQGRCD